MYSCIHDTAAYAQMRKYAVYRPYTYTCLYSTQITSQLTQTRRARTSTVVHRMLGMIYDW